MKNFGRRSLLLSLLVAGLSLPAGAQEGEGPEVPVKIETVQASTQGNSVEKGLEPMARAFQLGKLPYTSFKRLSATEVKLRKGKPAMVQLPNKRTATVSLKALKEDTARMGVKVTDLTEAEVTLGREGSVYQIGGKHGDGMLVLVLSPAK